MLIVSKFHDYYDSASAYGIDKTCVYKRETKTEGKERPDRHRFQRTVQDRDGKDWHPEKFVVGFCGKIYPAIKLTAEGYADVPFVEAPVKYFYEYDKLEKFLVPKKDKKRRAWHIWSGRELTNKEWFNPNSHKELEVLFDEAECPVFTHTKPYYEAECITVFNPCLKNVDFQKVTDPYTAFQEIYMFISGVLGTNENDMVNISDRDMLKKKGFDKWSFKKMPGK